MGRIRIGGYLMDLAMTEVHRFPGEATRYPVESGGDISDHIRELPEEIELTCIVSDTPTGDVANDPSRLTADGDPVTGEDLLDSRQGVSPAAPLPSVDALARLREMKSLRKPVTVETSLGAFASMAFIDLEVPRDKDKNNALFFTAKFQKIVVVSNKRTKIRVRTAMAGAGGKVKVAFGAAKGIEIRSEITWAHGEPPGAPWHEPNPVEKVFVGYRRPTGVPSKQVAGLLDETLRYEEIGYRSGHVEFFDVNFEQIQGDRLQALRKDLLRDRRFDDAARAKDPKFQDPRFGPDGQLVPRPRKQLPAGLDMLKWDLPLGPTVK